jgi:hypothetical protein
LQYSLAWQKQHLEQQISPIRSTFLQEQWEGLYDFSKEVIVPLQGIYNGIPPLLLEQHAQQIMHRLLADGEEHLTQYYLSLVRKQAS